MMMMMTKMTITMVMLKTFIVDLLGTPVSDDDIDAVRKAKELYKTCLNGKIYSYMYVDARPTCILLYKYPVNNTVKTEKI